MVYRQGSTGQEVQQIQQQLQALGLYNGQIDGDFGPGTGDAVIAFQQANGLSADGEVGPQTWAALFNTDQSTPAPPPAATTPQDSSSLAYNCLALAGAFETSKKPPQCFAGLAGSFDGQGISFGALQWNLGQGTLQPMLLQMDSQHSDVIDSLFGNNAGVLRNVLSQGAGDQMNWALSIQDSTHHIQPPWHDQFVALGLSDEYQQIEVAAAQQRFSAALSWCPTYGISSQRGVALMFDINVQNGSISQATKALILQDISQLQPSGDPSQDEVNKLTIIANRRADAAAPPYQEDVRTRKLCIANGQGTVHGVAYDLENDFGITLASAGV
jgi:hypothetical protein